MIRQSKETRIFDGRRYKLLDMSHDRISLSRGKFVDKGYKYFRTIKLKSGLFVLYGRKTK